MEVRTRKSVEEMGGSVHPDIRIRRRKMVGFYGGFPIRSSPVVQLEAIDNSFSPPTN